MTASQRIRGGRAPRTRNSAARRAIPAVGKLLERLADLDLPRPLVSQIVRQHLAALRRAEEIPPFNQIERDLRGTLDRLARSRLQPVINGTGIVLHTNFGRAPLSRAAVRRVAEIAAGYSNLEYDCVSGGRGSRAAWLERALALASGSEAATVVNNGAAALVLIVRHLTKKKSEVIISRGELVQIGGGFRVGEMLEASGARLREIGATKKTTLEDYAKTIGPETALILRVHQSNFFIGGFTESPPNDAVASLARKRRVPLVVDLGSGALSGTETLGLPEHEPTPSETVRQGADLVCFSGDKLSGGPQAGIIAGKARLIRALKREPLFRALRCDKMVFAALEATIDLHLRKATDEIPALHLLSLPTERLEARGRALLARVRELPIEVRLGENTTEIGGGALPRSRVRSIALEFTGAFPPNELAACLRAATPPVVGYVAGGRFRLDLRTIFPEQDELVVAALRKCLTKNRA
jgi:L-seryl-tRNA(Ser) seleniumtransferase